MIPGGQSPTGFAGIAELIKALMMGNNQGQAPGMPPLPGPPGPALPQAAGPVGPQGAPGSEMDPLAMLADQNGPPFPVPPPRPNGMPDLAGLAGPEGTRPDYMEETPPFPVPSTDGTIPPELATLLGNPSPEMPSWRDAAVGGGLAQPRPPGRSVEGPLSTTMPTEMGKSRARVMPDPGLALLRAQSNPMDEQMALMGAQGMPEMPELDPASVDLSELNQMPPTDQTSMGEQLPMSPEQRRRMLAQLFGIG